MLKKTTLLFSFIFAFNIAFASTASLKTNLNENYSGFIQTSKSTYNYVKNQIQVEKEKVGIWDYKILSYLTWTSIDYLNTNSQTGYQYIIKKLTSSKYDIISKIDLLENNYENSFITTWEYENWLEDMNSLISWYNIESNKDINLYKKNMDDALQKYISNIELKKEKLNYKIQTYKHFESDLSGLNNAYKSLETKNTKLENIIWISKDLLNKKSWDIKDYVDNYFSWYVQKQYQSLVDSNINYTYFDKKFKDKKEIILWFISNKLNNIILSIVNNYYPDIKLQDIKKQVEEINNLSVDKIVNDYTNIKDNIQKVNNTVENDADKVLLKLSKFGNSTERNDILKVLKEDIVAGIKKTLPTVENELNSTFKNWKDFIVKKENGEQPIMDNILVSYNNTMILWDIQKLKEFETTLEDYKNVVILPTNLEKIRKYKLAIEQKIEEVKYQEVANQIKDILTTVNNFKIWDNKSKIDQIRIELKTFESYENFSTQINAIKFKLILQENLDKIYEIWAIRYYYQYGDLSDTVENILTKYYDKYKQEGKKAIFDKKIKIAFEKIDILMSSLSNDKRSYYIIMIYNGLLKFRNNNI